MDESIGELLKSGQTLLNTGNPKEAMKMFEKVLEISPNHIDALTKKGNILGKITDSIDSIGSVISNNIVDISGRIIKNSENKEIFNFGKYKNQIVSDVFKSNPEYYHWIMKSNFPQHSKKKFTEIKLREN